MMRDVRITNDKASVGESRTIDIVGHGTHAAVFSDNMSVKLLDMVYVQDLSYDLFWLMAAQKRGVGFMPEESGMCFSVR